MKNPFGKTASRILLPLLFISVMVPPSARSQDQIAHHILELKTRGRFKEKIQPFTIKTGARKDLVSAVKKYAILQLDATMLSNIVSRKPETIRMVVPAGELQKSFTILLYRSEISPSGFNLIASDKSSTASDPIVNYRGSLEDDAQSVAAFSFSGNETMGMISNNNGNVVLGRIEKDPDGLFILYNDHDLTRQSSIGCDELNSPAVSKSTGNPLAGNSLPVSSTPATSGSTESSTTQTTRCVNWYWETDYDLFVNKGSLANVNAYIQGVFNQVSTLYANDGISINLKTLFVWTTPDPYTGVTSADYLDRFAAYRTSWNGDLAHLIGFGGNGGIAYVDGLQMCDNGASAGQSSSQMGYSGISTGYNAVPTYSWTVQCLAHEQGHQLGSHHTHACVWNGNNTKIDDCGGTAGYSAGSCLPQPVPAVPVGGGTIMSYCHLTSAGINFSLGFGPQPRALIASKINASTCLTSCVVSCATPGQPGAITGSTSVCANTSKTYSVAPVAGATGYLWTLPSGWAGSSSTNSINVTTGPLGGALTVKAINDCGSSIVTALQVTSGIPSQPTVITGNTKVCPASVQTYSVDPVSGAASYIWTLPAGWTGSSTNNSIDAMPGTTDGMISVKAANGCGSSAAQTLNTIIGKPAPAQPGNISGSTSVCAGTSQIYSVSAVSNADSYTWTLPSGWSGASNTNTLSVTTGSAAGTVSVSASNSCGTSPATILNTTLTSVPSTPGAISIAGGINKICPGDSRTFSVTATPGTVYQWSVPAGIEITGGQGSNTIDVVANTEFTSSGAISVKASNACATSNARNFSLNTNVPSTPSSINVVSGNAKVCPGDTAQYRVTAVSGVSYSWTAPPGAEILEGQGTNEVTVTYTNTFSSSSNLSVRAINSCGASNARNLTINENNPARPSSISVSEGSAKVCPGDRRRYSFTPVSGLLYEWSVPAGMQLLSGQGTSSVVISFDEHFTEAADISVTAANSCGISLARTLSIVPNSPSTPGAISGPVNVCPGAISNYSVSSVNNALSYTWTVPGGAAIQGIQNANSIKVAWGSTAGTISVRSVNSCGISSAKSLVVKIYCTSLFVNKPESWGNKPSLSPNPSAGNTTLSFYADKEEPYRIELHDLTGRLLSYENFDAVRGMNYRANNWSHFAAGMYMVILKNRDGHKVLKLEIR